MHHTRFSVYIKLARIVYPDASHTGLPLLPNFPSRKIDGIVSLEGITKLRFIGSHNNIYGYKRGFKDNTVINYFFLIQYFII